MEMVSKIEEIIMDENGYILDALGNPKTRAEMTPEERAAKSSQKKQDNLTEVCCADVCWEQRHPILNYSGTD